MSEWKDESRLTRYFLLRFRLVQTFMGLKLLLYCYNWRYSFVSLTMIKMFL